MKHDPNCAIVRLGDIRAWCDCEGAPGLVGELYWRTPSGAMIELKRVGNKFYHELVPGVRGVPVYYAIWPEPKEEKSDVE